MMRNQKKHFILIILIFISNIVIAQRPNILWITVEDISPTLSFYGDSTSLTPNLDKLASQSLIYKEAFTTVGVCAPSRSSLITGMYPVSIGTHQMRTGKDVFSWGSRDYSGISNAIDVNGDSIPLHSVVTPVDVKCFTEYMRKDGYFCTNNSKTDYQFAAPVTAWDENGNNSHWRNRPIGKPFFSVFNFNTTHESKMWMHRDKPLTVDPESVKLPPYYPDTKIVRQDVARNYSNIEMVDKEIGKLLFDLESDGLLDNTIIFFFSDHGGPLPRGKREHYVSGLNVPFLVRIPGLTDYKYVYDPISFVDLAPTVLSLVDIEIPDHFQGKAFLGKKKNNTLREFIYGSGDRFDETYDRVRSVISKDFVYVKNYYKNLPAYKDNLYRKNIDMTNEMLEMNKNGLLDKNQSYWYRQKKTKEEFYVRDNDPHSLNNLINDKKYKDQIIKHRKALKDWQKEINDIGGMAEKSLFYKMWPNGAQPKANSPIINGSDKLNIIISSDTEGASIAYIISKKDFQPGLDDGWLVYSKPLTLLPGENLYAMTTRIGYEDSEVIKYEN